MRLLFDENLSPRLPAILADLFPDSRHVRDAGLKSADDEGVWVYAIREALIIVSKDDDFRGRSFLHGHPPKVIGVLLGNCSTRLVAQALRESHKQIALFERDESAAYLAIT